MKIHSAPDRLSNLPRRLAEKTGAWARRVRYSLALLSFLFVSPWPATAANRPPLVMAAASLQESVTAAARQWAAQGHPEPIISFAASSALARQVEAGAPADLFISADERWMDELQKRNLLLPASRSNFLGNELVLIAPKGSRLKIRIGSGFPLARALGGGRLAVADPTAVPAGIYAKAALKFLGVWKEVQDKLAPAENVRAALAFVERGETPLGIVYATDALASKRVEVIGRFPAKSHEPIVYPIAVLRSSTSAETVGFRHFLVSPAGKAIFRRFGFTTP